MKKILVLIVAFLVFVSQVSVVFAAENSFVNIVNPIRGKDFWDTKNQDVDTVVKGQVEILNKYDAPATWLIRPDALNDSRIKEILNKRKTDETGLFLEITPTLTDKAQVRYRQSKDWHSPGSAFLTGYEQEERKKIIDTAFESFKQVFNYYPKSVGAWWIDAYSLSYMSDKYQITAALIVADQYSTDNYQIWGQYWATPYYPSIKNALIPAQQTSEKIPVVLTQWAARDPINGYGKGVEESTYSVQLNDYIDFHELGIDYFASLVDIYTKPGFDQFGQIVVGLENTYSWEKYKIEYDKQIKLLSEKQKQGQFRLAKMTEFSDWYQFSYPEISPMHIISANDPLGSDKKAVWFMNPYYRVGWFYQNPGSSIQDIRQYISSSEEICYLRGCDKLNFATYTTRVLDYVTYGHNWLLDQGRIKGFTIGKNNGNYTLSYTNEAGDKRNIEFLPRDILLDSNVYTIDKAILEITSLKSFDTKKDQSHLFKQSQIKDVLNFSLVLKFVVFLGFVVIALLIPGLVFTRNIKELDLPLRVFVSLTSGLVVFTMVGYLLGMTKLYWLSFVYILAFLILFLKFRIYNEFANVKPVFNKLNFAIFLTVILGIIFQIAPVFKSGIVFKDGMGFWGPNGHDGVWHLALINQLIKNIPPENPVFSGEVLKNYHFFYDLLVALTAKLTTLSVSDLLFRFFPIIFSLLLGIGTYYLFKLMFQNYYNNNHWKLGAIFSLLFVYFAGSFGWIVEYFKNKSLGGESDFWINQPVSFNLNPPFAISLIIFIAFIILLNFLAKGRAKLILLLSVLSASLVGFKAYGAILIFLSLLPFALFSIFTRKSFNLFAVLVFGLIIGFLIFALGYKSTQALIGASSQSLFIFSPFWFIHSMLDSPDRVGLTRITLMRMVGYETSNLLKIITSELIGLVVFVVGNLGLRFLGLLVFFRKSLFKNFFFSEGKQSNGFSRAAGQSNGLFTYSMFLGLVSFIIPTFFIQTGNPWNTIQFSYYGLFIFALFAGFELSRLLTKLPKVFAYPLLILILILTPINSITTAKGYLINAPHAYVSSEELEGLQILSKKDEGVVLIYPYDKNIRDQFGEPLPLFAYDTSAYISALTNKPTFLSDISQNEILQTSYEKRLVINNDFFRYLSPTGGSSEKIKKAGEVLRQNNIRYIYLLKEYKIKVDADKLNLKKIFENNSVEVYERLLN
ncbi:hypothetical protein HYW42_02690 [Candidatus Daviesbacteria bacterium]|nr:hypothetical protein [Candidatus Daviesbacteria bacterium]